jgi:hypothetical protein
VSASNCELPGVSEWMWSVILEASISGEYWTQGEHSGGLLNYLKSLMMDIGVPWESLIALKQYLNEAFKLALKQALKPALKRTLSNNVQYQ